MFRLDDPFDQSGADRFIGHNTVGELILMNLDVGNEAPDVSRT